MSSPEAFAILVAFDLQHGAAAAFLPLVAANAARSVSCEPGCLRFDVLTPAGETDRILLYEIYADPPAFDAHLASEHYRSFDAATRHLVARKTVTRLALQEHAKS